MIKCNNTNCIDSLLINEYKALALAISHKYKKHPVVRNDNAVDMDDIEQLALIGLWNAISTHSSDEGPLGPWIRLNVHRSIADWLRDFGCIVKIPRDVQQRGSEVAVMAIDNTPEQTYTPTDMSLEEARRVLTKAITCLAPGPAKIVSMRWGIPNGRTYRVSEISDCMRVSRRYVYNAFKKAMKDLPDDAYIKEALDVIT